MYTYSKPVLRLSAIRSTSFLDFFRGYEAELVGSGYNPHVVRFHLHSVAHFGVWLELKGAQLGAIDEGTVRMVLAAVRMFLRYLAAEGRCRVGLEQALLSSATWSQQSLPQGLTPEELQRILAFCPTTPTGLRDRSVLLLLSRLGLRAGEVAALRLTDVCFETATIKVSGKGRREVQLHCSQRLRLGARTLSMEGPHDAACTFGHHLFPKPPRR